MEIDAPHLRYDSSDESDISDYDSKDRIASESLPSKDITELRFVVKTISGASTRSFDRINIFLDPIHRIQSIETDKWSLYGAIIAPNYINQKSSLMPSATDVTHCVSKLFMNRANSPQTEVNVLVSTEFKPELFFGWTSALFEVVSAKSVKIIGCGPHSFSGYNNLNLRKFYTEAVAQSAIVLGLAACIINYCKSRSIPIISENTSGMLLSNDILANNSKHSSNYIATTDAMFT